MNTQCRTKTQRRTMPKCRRQATDQIHPPQAKRLDLPEAHSAHLDFSALGSRQVLASFDGGDISSDGGGLLLRKTEELTGIIRQFASCFTDHRNPQLTEHTLEHLLAQRVYALAAKCHHLPITMVVRRWQVTQPPYHSWNLRFGNR